MAPDRGDLIWIDFDPQAGHEQAGRRPALVLSPRGYHQRTHLAIVCPVTSQRKGYPFEVPLPDGLAISGVVLADQVNSIDRRARRIEPAGSVALYELRVGDNHHHVVCRRCGTVGDVDCAVGRRPCLTPSQAHGFVLDEAEVTYWGLCPDCQTAPPPPGAGARVRAAGEVDMGPQKGEEKRSGARRGTRERRRERGGGDE